MAALLERRAVAQPRRGAGDSRAVDDRARTFFDITVYPVLDVQEAARIGGEALEFIRSA